MVTRLLAIAAALECLAGLALIVWPALAIAVVLDVQPHVEALMIGRLAGVALVALGVACAVAAAAPVAAAGDGTLAAITLYNAGAGALLGLWAATGEAGGIVVQLAAILHLALAVALLAAAIDAPRYARQRWSGS